MGRRNGTKKEQNQFSLLPTVLIIEILLRLPVESLLRFKTVCKDWYSLLTSSDFVQNHFDHYSNCSSLLVYHGGINTRFSKTFSTFSDESLSSETPLRCRVLDYMYMDDGLDVLGPIRGLFCITRDCDGSTDKYGVILVNPATRECKPLLVPDTDLEHWSDFQMYGFGIDILTGDFKVVSTWCWNESQYELPSTRPLRTAVFSLANDSWIYHDIDPFITQTRKKICNSGSLYINGSCYWLLRGNNNIVYVHWFDLTSEVLRQLRGPENSNSLGKESRLVLHNDTPAIFIFQPFQTNNPRYIDLMVMKEEKYWTKDLSIDISSLMLSCVPLGFWKNTNHLLARRGYYTMDWHLILYDCTTCEVKELGCSYTYSTFTYKESLISLKGESLDHVIQYFFDTCTIKQSHNQTRRARMELKMSSFQRKGQERRKVKRCSKTRQINNTSTFFHMLFSGKR